jgi:hypothetical protein
LGSVELGKKDEVSKGSPKWYILNFDFLMLNNRTDSSLVDYHGCAFL